MKRQQGVALVEFALVLPLFLVLTLITTELGRALYQYNSMTKSVREAARYLSSRAAAAAVSDKERAIVAEAKNIVVYGNPRGTGTALVPGITLSNVPDPEWGTAGTYPTFNTVTVTVQNYTFTPLFRNAFGVRFNTMTFSPIRATMRSPL
jgi:Flp pilus assembly protein TadG